MCVSYLDAILLGTIALQFVSGFAVLFVVSRKSGNNCSIHIKNHWSDILHRDLRRKGQGFRPVQSDEKEAPVIQSEREGNVIVSELVND